MKADLNSMDLLRDVSELTRVRLAASGIMRWYDRGEAIIWTQDECCCMYFILEGQVEVYRHIPGGREQILDRLGAGACFNLVPVCLGITDNLASVRALKKSRVLAVPRNEFSRLMEADISLALAVARFFAARLEYMTRLIEDLSLYSVRQRLARFLIDQADQKGSEKGANWTQTDMANRLGTVRDVLGRALRKLADEGALRFDRDRIVLINRAMLEKIASGER